MEISRTEVVVFGNRRKSEENPFKSKNGITGFLGCIDSDNSGLHRMERVSHA